MESVSIRRIKPTCSGGSDASSRRPRCIRQARAWACGFRARSRACMMVTSPSSPSPAWAALSRWRFPWIQPQYQSPDVRSRFRPARPLDLALTLSAIGPGPSMRIRDGEAWRATHTPDGPATVRLARDAEGLVDVDAWGPGAEWAAAAAPVMCGEEDDDSGYQPAHPALAA